MRSPWTATAAGTSGTMFPGLKSSSRMPLVGAKNVSSVRLGGTWPCATGAPASGTIPASSASSVLPRILTRSSLARSHDDRPAAVAVPEHQLHQPPARREPARPRPAPEAVAVLLEPGAHDRRPEQPGRRAHPAVRADHA